MLVYNAKHQFTCRHIGCVTGKQGKPVTLGSLVALLTA